MPWLEKSVMSQRHEFVMLFEQEGVNRRELCRRFGISPAPDFGPIVCRLVRGSNGFRARNMSQAGRSCRVVASLSVSDGIGMGDAKPLFAGGYRASSDYRYDKHRSRYGREILERLIAGMEQPISPHFQARSDMTGERPPLRRVGDRSALRRGGRGGSRE